MVAHEFECPEQAGSAHLAEARRPVEPGFEFRPDDASAEFLDSVEDAVALEHPERRDADGAGERMPGVEEPAGIDAVVEGAGDLLRHDDAAERRELLAVRCLP